MSCAILMGVTAAAHTAGSSDARVCCAGTEKEFGVDVSARKPVIKAIALAYCQEKGEDAAAAGASLGPGIPQADSARSICIESL